ncbi:pyridoxal phosphate-dependent aminotransferase [Marinobacter sp. M3C]|jgi:aspartate/methionine/tyrosine aminotransferase|uniref:pyridoxal phosphate-dependent aminotransferase n=1 Tax=unclassified Marinobacter TaxID=83889 RepID=UPI0020101DC6|nr:MULTISPECIES: pyridoxal phosphate-dependent aminotransferase [unclassified Marinobacter]MCL1479470.1 pyridoxal phosphate-dependent aminotransferase [Marinobacter sp.]MCL1482145.1 pyridoxal phosphate-dependent aminotransferase [Marinobacter sp.]MCL1483174.1 pyridoxal phosphate-dependent aminotransferase [Marinobacter sp.]MCL1488544.1 pyridoxal phosphate-dependent aminotransferase [Marinobacter sp.]UQG54611.1 pyridoxal phosphate-dependent aminotransferase [Marinobacter sp. M4C]
MVASANHESSQAKSRTVKYRKTKASWNPAMQAVPIPGIRRMVNLAATMKDVIHLSIGQPDLPTPKHIIDAYVDALHAGQTGYTMDAGLPELVIALRDYYSKRYNRKLTRDNILVTNGATEAMYLAIAATAAPGRQFLVTDPSFLLYAPLIRMNGGEVKYVPTHVENNHQLDPNDVIRAIGPRTFALVLNNPNNPTGAVYPRSTVEAILEECAYRGVQVYADEVYDHLIFDDDEFASVLTCAVDLDNIMCISSFSKTYSMAGLRIGWVISSQAAIKSLRRYHMFTTSVANTPAQFAGVAALNGDQQCVHDMVDIYRERRDRVVDLIAQTPHLSGYKPGGAFFAFPDLPPHVDGTDLALRMLKETGVCVVPGDSFGEGCTNALRFSFSTTCERLDAAFDRIIPWMAKQNL